MSLRFSLSMARLPGAPFVLYSTERGGVWVAPLDTILYEWGNWGLSEEAVHSTTQIWVISLCLSYFKFTTDPPNPTVKVCSDALKAPISPLSPYSFYKLSIFHEEWVVLSSCPMTSPYVFHEWWMRTWEAKALNIIYGNTSQPFLRPHAKPFLCLPPVT